MLHLHCHHIKLGLVFLSFDGFRSFMVRMFQRFSWCIESNAFSKSTKIAYSVAYHSTTCSIMLWRMNNCPAVLYPLLEPARSSLNLLSILSLILSNITLLNTLLGTNMPVIPLKFTHCKISFLFRILTISPIFYIFSTFPCSQIDLNKHRCKFLLSSYFFSTILL